MVRIPPSLATGALVARARAHLGAPRSAGFARVSPALQLLHGAATGVTPEGPLIACSLRYTALRPTKADAQGKRPFWRLSQPSSGLDESQSAPTAPGRTASATLAA